MSWSPALTAKQDCRKEGNEGNGALGLTVISLQHTEGTSIINVEHLLFSLDGEIKKKISRAHQQQNIFQEPAELV